MGDRVRGDDGESKMLNLCDIEMYLQNEIRAEITLLVKGRKATFFCDTGACRTRIHPQDMPKNVQ